MYIRLILLLVIFLSGCLQGTQPPYTPEELEQLNNPNAEVLSLVERHFDEWHASFVQNEAFFLEGGIALTRKQQAIARQLGVKHPERVRVLISESFTPGRDPGKMGGAAAGYGVWINEKYQLFPIVLAHELVHVAQFERLGRDEMLRRVMVARIVLPSDVMPPLEREAYQKSERFIYGQR